MICTQVEETRPQSSPECEDSGSSAESDLDNFDWRAELKLLEQENRAAEVIFLHCTALQFTLKDTIAVLTVDSKLLECLSGV